MESGTFPRVMDKVARWSYLKKQTRHQDAKCMERKGNVEMASPSLID